MKDVTKANQFPSGWRFRAGVFFFAMWLICPLFIPLVSATDIPTQWKATLSGLLFFGIPQLFGLVAVALLGKSGFNYIKERFFGFFKKYVPPERVSRTRYRIGLVMFLLPLVSGWLVPYAPHFIPGYEEHRFIVNLAGDVIFLSSLFVLGGEFWDKVRALFIYN